jgi:hypothetical protein
MEDPSFGLPSNKFVVDIDFCAIDVEVLAALAGVWLEVAGLLACMEERKLPNPLAPRSWPVLGGFAMGFGECFTVTFGRAVEGIAGSLGTTLVRMNSRCGPRGPTTVG